MHGLLTLLVIAIIIGALLGARTFGGTVRLGCFVIFLLSGFGILALIFLLFVH